MEFNIMEFLVWPANSTHIILATDFHDKFKPALRVGGKSL
jgi:hypothetical protein